MGFFKSFVALVHVYHPLDPLLPLEERSNAHRIDAVLSAVERREAHLDGYGTLHCVEVIRGSVVDLALMVVNPAVVTKRVDEWSAVAVREGDGSGEGRAVGVAGQCLQHLLDIVHAHHVIVIHEGDILSRGLGEQHASLLTDAQLTVVREVKNLYRLASDLLVEIKPEIVQRVLAFVQRGNQD